MATLTLDLPDWTSDYLFLRVHRITNAQIIGRSIIGGGGFSSHFNSSPGSIPLSISAGLIVYDAEYAPFGHTPVPIVWAGSQPGSEQYVYDNAQAHVGYRFAYTSTAIVAGTHAASWSPATSQLSYAVSRIATIGVPVISTLGSGSAVPGQTSVSVPIGGLSGFDITRDILFLFVVNGGTQGVDPVRVSVSGTTLGRVYLDPNSLPPAHDGGGPLGLDQFTGLAVSVHAPHAVGGFYLLAQFLPPVATLRHRFKARQ